MVYIPLMKSSMVSVVSFGYGVVQVLESVQ